MEFCKISEVIEALQNAQKQYGDIPAIVSINEEVITPLQGISVFEPNENKGEFWCLFHIDLINKTE